MDINIRTFAFIIGLTHFIQFIVIYYQYKVNKNYKGIGWWLIWSLIEVLGFLIIVIRGYIFTNSFLIILQNSLIISGTIFVYVGIMSFFGKKANWKAALTILAAFVIILSYFTFIDYNLIIRTVVINATLSTISYFTAYNLYKHKFSSVKSSANFLTVVLLIHGIVFTYLTIAIIFISKEYEIYSSSSFNVIQYTDAFIVGLLWTFGFIIMINQRLNAENSEEKDQLELIFNSSPDSALMTSLSDGYFLRINEGFFTLTGYTREDVSGKSSKDINLWSKPFERDVFVKTLKEKGVVENEVYEFNRKDGTVITGMVSARLIHLNGIQSILTVTRDINERIRAELKLKESEDRLARAEKVAKIGNWKLMLDTKELISSAGANFIYGIENRKLLLEDIQRFPLPKYREMLDNALTDLINNNIPYNIEFKIQRPNDGKIIDIHSLAEYDKENNIIYGVIHDITEQKKAEERLHNIFINAPAGIFHSDWTGKLLTVNPALARMLGYSSPEELISIVTDMSTQIYVNPETRQRIMDTLNTADGWSHWDEVLWKRKDNSIITVDMTGRKVLNENGEFSYLEGFIVDVTEQKIAEEALRKSEENFKAIANYAASWEAWFSTKGQLLWMNSYSEQLTGYTPEEYMAADDYLSMVIAEEDIEMVREEFFKAINGSSGDNLEARVPRKDGSKFWVSMSWRPILDSAGKSLGFRTSARDITNRKNIEEMINLQNEELNRINKEKDKFFSIIAHDLRSPFNGFLGLTELMVSDISKMTLVDINKIADNLHRSAKNLYRLLTNLLEWSKIQRGLTDFNPKKLSLKCIINESISLFNESARKKSINISEEIPDNYNVFADSSMLNTIIRNLISNALKFTISGGNILLSAKEKGNMIEISVKDNGIGMNNDIIDSLFKIDKQSTRKGTEGEPSTGLGLLLCKEFINKNDGQIFVESEEGKGSEFRITLKNVI
jgi:PAS domain S-box-containing protein